MDVLPSGVLTLLFTDIENSSRMWDEHRSDMAAALVQHNEILRSVIEGQSGFVVKDKGDGFFAGFLTPVAAVDCALEIQRRLQSGSWPDTIDLRVRMGIHAGSVEAHEGDYHGPTVNQVARIEGLAHGGQVLLSDTVATLLGGELPASSELRDLGEHTLKGIGRPIRLHQLIAPDLPGDFPPLVSAKPVGVALPDFPSSFVGREDERATLVEMFSDEENRLVTLLGPGGIGKTRLAVETARDLASRLDGRAFFADLTQVQRPSEVPSAIAEAVGVHAEGEASPVALVADRITAPTLLLIDNFEHVNEASGVVGDLMAAAPEVRVLATSRTPLQLRGEMVYRVDPLSLANGDGRLPAAVVLFYDRAAGHGVTIAQNGPEAEAVRSIVRRVDGLPLAIELVAARTRVLGVTDLDERLQKSLSVMGKGGADLPERQRTIQSTIDWSLANVTDSQQRLFRRLAALPAGASLEVLEEVAAYDLDEDPLDAIQGLVDNSLINVERGLPGGTRYRQLVPMREHGAALLDQMGETDVVMDRLVTHYADTAASLARRFEHDDSVDRQLRGDHPNLLAAMHWSLAHNRAADLVKAFNEIWVYWFNADVGVTAVDWIEAADRVVDSPYMDWLVGFFAFQSGDFETVAGRMMEAIEGFAAIGDQRCSARAKLFAGAVLPDIEQGRQLIGEAIDHFSLEEAGISRFLPLLFLSITSIQLGDIDEALDLRRQLLEWSEAADYRILIGWGHWNLSLALMAADRMGEAETHARQALEILADDGYQEGIASAADLIGIVEADRGNYETALRIFGASDSMFANLRAHRWFEDEMFVDRARELAKEKLGDDEVARLTADGASLKLDELVALAR